MRPVPTGRPKAGQDSIKLSGFVLRLYPEDHAALRQAAKAKGETVSEYCRNAVAARMAAERNKP